VAQTSAEINGTRKEEDRKTGRLRFGCQVAIAERGEGKRTMDE
jgi:hypothetical protein